MHRPVLQGCEDDIDYFVCRKFRWKSRSRGRVEGWEKVLQFPVGGVCLYPAFGRDNYQLRGHGKRPQQEKMV